MPFATLEPKRHSVSSRKQCSIAIAMWWEWESAETKCAVQPSGSRASMLTRKIKDCDLTVHAGESAGPESIAAAVNLLHAERIGHGLTAIQDPRLVELLAEKQVAVEICLSSNLRTGCCARIEDHPLKRYFDAGVLVTLNTDDPEMFETTLNREYQIAQEAFGFTDAQLAQLARNSFAASFLPEERRASCVPPFQGL